MIGGWRVTASGRPRDAEWFSLTLTRATAPWAYARGDPFRTIAALELFGVLVSLVVLVPVVQRAGEVSAMITLTCFTDNQGNSFLLDKLLTTRYPLGVVLMQLAHEMKKRKMQKVSVSAYKSCLLNWLLWVSQMWVSLRFLIGF